MFISTERENLDSFNKGEKICDVPEAVEGRFLSSESFLGKEMREVGQRIAKEFGGFFELLGEKEIWRSVFVFLRGLAVFQVFTRVAI
ncbi:MAG: hypothetical protein Ct9H90mP27_4180 [Gammaproteobacteria bacterium]|nr:MAG: hypothetical protein Ct9H90mP27_4180 [Gammaproteobacteria bacterium]